VYVVQLDARVWNEPRFRKANPDHQLSKPLVHVGMTRAEPDPRFDKHKAGFKARLKWASAGRSISGIVSAPESARRSSPSKIAASVASAPIARATSTGRLRVKPFQPARRPAGRSRTAASR
jgi:hypothetical protein